MEVLDPVVQDADPDALPCDPFPVYWKHVEVQLGQIGSGSRVLLQQLHC